MRPLHPIHATVAALSLLAAAWAGLPTLRFVGASALPAADAADDGGWQKFKGKPEPIGPAPTFATPGMFLPPTPRLVAFPAGGLPVDLPLDATLPTGKPVRAAILPNRMLWIDVNGDGKPDLGERFPPTRTGYGPVTIPLKYKNGSEAPYSFHLVETTTAGTYKLVTGQMIRYSISWNHRQLTLLLLDQNNNGRYDDADADVVMEDQRPGCFLAKTITVGMDAGSVAEIVVYPDGTTIEMRPYAGPTGILDPVSQYTPAQSGVTLQYLAMDGKLSRPGFSAAFPRARVPVDSYAFRSAALQRGTESVHVERGALAEVAVQANQTATLAWGGTVELKYGFRRDGENLVFDAFQFVGKDHQEIYLPQPPFTLNTAYRAEELVPAGYGSFYGATQNVLLGAGTLDRDADGKYLPLKIPHHDHPMVLLLHIDYPSGVMGPVNVSDKLQFTPQDKKP
ncbi:MAG: hypothetical protein ACREJ2_03270 [Planctomycetota bacterium]